jgi:predicted Fe-Mo cluster-binding NifX family protein
MSIKVAVASSDGIVVNQHFGHTEQFIIYDLKDKADFTFLEVRKINPPCSFGTHNQNALEEAVEKISDCNYVLCYQIGKGAYEVLKERGIYAFAVGDYIEAALIRLLKTVIQQNINQ